MEPSTVLNIVAIIVALITGIVAMIAFFNVMQEYFSRRKPGEKNRFEVTLKLEEGNEVVLNWDFDPKDAKSVHELVRAIESASIQKQPEEKEAVGGHQ